MRSLFLFLLPFFLLTWGCSQEKQDQTEMHEDHQMMENEEAMVQNSDQTMHMDSTSMEKIIYYTCPMESHKHVHSSEPGKCPECGMALVAGVITSEENMEFYGCPMEAHSHVRSDKPGDCPECGMTLKPMRLDKNKSMNM